MRKTDVRVNGWVGGNGRSGSCLPTVKKGEGVINQKQLINVLIGVCVGVIAGVSGMVLRRQVQPAPIVIVPPEPTAIPMPTPTPGLLSVFVNGAVAVPDVYELPPDSLVESAIAAAGGFAEPANTAVVNLAQPLHDGVQVYVPFLEDEVVLPAAGVNEPEPVAGRTSSFSTGVDVGNLVNINRADLATLDTLPGIGPGIAQKIVEYRDANGPFQTIEEIKRVSGIGDAKFDQIQALITVDD